MQDVGNQILDLLEPDTPADDAALVRTMHQLQDARVETEFPFA